MITPFSARTRFTAIGKVDIGLMGVFLVLNSSIVSSANFLIIAHPGKTSLALRSTAHTTESSFKYRL
jgi:hypothetical protein